jgi:AcrR family transcriptional regulator
VPPRGPFPERPTYDDVPFWEHNFDNVETRTINAAWNQLFTIDLTDLSFHSLARSVGVSPAAIYHHFSSPAALGAALASKSCVTLNQTLTFAGDFGQRRPRPLEELVKAYLEFAFKRKRHFALSFSPQFSSADRFPEVMSGRRAIASTLWTLWEEETGREPEIEDLQVFWGMLHGSAALIAANHVPQPERLILTCRAFLAQASQSSLPNLNAMP